ncbi:MAG: hypothetical protein ABI234_12730 [Ktedonobacteraceae bacterium]
MMEVLNENKEVVPGYRTLTGIGVTPKRRGILSQKVLSSEEPGFLSRTGGGANNALDGEYGSGGTESQQAGDLAVRERL